MPRLRLDRLLVARGLAPTREKAQAMILAGAVSVGGLRVDKAGAPVDEAADVTVAGPPAADKEKKDFKDIVNKYSDDDTPASATRLWDS